VRYTLLRAPAASFKELTMEKLWIWFNGKKTAIGGIYSLTVGFAVANAWINDVSANYLLGIGAIILGVGVGHKVAKNGAKK